MTSLKQLPSLASQAYSLRDRVEDLAQQALKKDGYSGGDYVNGVPVAKDGSGRADKVSLSSSHGQKTTDVYTAIHADHDSQLRLYSDEDHSLRASKVTASAEGSQVKDVQARLYDIYDQDSDFYLEKKTPGRVGASHGKKNTTYTSRHIQATGLFGRQQTILTEEATFSPEGDLLGYEVEEAFENGGAQYRGHRYESGLL